MRYVAMMGLVCLVAAGCGGETDNEMEELPLAATSDSLVPIADDPSLPDDRPAAPPETVYVASQTPPPSTPRANRPASVPTPPPSTPEPVADPEPAPEEVAQPSPSTLGSGTAFATVTLDSVHSRYNKVGDKVRVRVGADLVGNDGRVAIPVGSVVTLTITEIKPAPNRGDAGTLVLSAQSVSILGESYPLTARATDFEYQLKGRGITGKEATKTGIGAVAGGLIGRVVGGKDGTVIGAIGGAAAGAAVADQQADRDIIVTAGTQMTITLRDTFEGP